MWTDRVRKFLSSDNWKENDDWFKVEALLASVSTQRTRTPKEGLSRELFNRILEWKLRSQRNKTEHLRILIPDSTIMQVTKLSFSIDHPDPNALLSMQAKLLTALPGVGIGVASAILTLYYPERCGIIRHKWDGGY